jgi:hypothetical protein
MEASSKKYFWKRYVVKNQSFTDNRYFRVTSNAFALHIGTFNGDCLSALRRTAFIIAPKSAKNNQAFVSYLNLGGVAVHGADKRSSSFCSVLGSV